MGITFNVSTNTIVVTGYTVGTPCNFTDIYNADVAGAWGVVTRQCTNQFCFDCKLQVGNGSTSTWFADELVQVKWNSGLITAHNQNILDVLAHGHFRLGRLLDSIKKTSGYGCQIYCGETTYQAIFGLKIAGCANTDIEYYSSSFNGNTNALSLWLFCKGATGKIYNCHFSDRCDIAPYDLDIYNLIVTRCKGISNPKQECNLINVFKSDYAFYVSTNINAVIKNCVIVDATYLLYCDSISTDKHVINVVSDSWTFNWAYTSTAKVYRKYEYDLKVIQENSGRTPILGATVKIWDLNDNLVTDTTTDANGEIATQTLIFGYYNQAGGNTPVMETPHKIEIRKNGSDFLTVTKYMYIDYTRREVISMVDMSNITDKLDVIQADLDDPDQYKADVSGVASENTVNKIWSKIRKGKGILKLT